MGINKEILIYQNLPFKKYRWISYLSAIQLGFLLTNILLIPPEKLKKERREAQAKHKEKMSNKGPSDEFQSESVSDPENFAIIEKIKKLTTGDLFSLQNFFDNVRDNPYLSIGLMSASAVMFGALNVYARRTIHTITLLPSERVRLTFFTPTCVGKAPSLDIPITKISCVSPRTTPNNYSILKLQGYIGYHLVSKKEGEFVEPVLYDQYLGYSRSWAES